MVAPTANGVVRTLSFSDEVDAVYGSRQEQYGESSRWESLLPILVLVSLLALGFRLGQRYLRYLTRAVREDALAEEIARSAESHYEKLGAGQNYIHSSTNC